MNAWQGRKEVTSEGTFTNYVLEALIGIIITYLMMSPTSIYAVIYGPPSVKIV